MAVVNLKSQVVTDLDATPVVKTSPHEIGGVVREAVGTIAVTDDDATSTFRLVRVPSRARITDVFLANDDLDGATPALAVDVGLYLSEGGAVVDVDFFASAITQLQAAAGYTDVTYESAVVDLPNRGKRLWEQLALTVDPEVEYDVALTVTTAAGTFQAGDILMKVRYVLPE